MTTSHPHWRRSAIIAGIGLFVATISVIWVGMYVRSVGPQTISLAYRLDMTKTLVFVRSTTIENFEDRIVRANVLFPATNQFHDWKSLPKGVSYEYALMEESGNEPMLWIIEVHLRNQEEKIVASGRVDLLPIEDIRRSLGASDLFRREGGRDAADCTFIRLERMPILNASGSSILRAIAAPFSSLLLIHATTSGGQLMFEKRDESHVAMKNQTIALPSQTPSPLFALALSDPKAMLDSIGATLRENDPATFEGLRGILQERLETWTHRSDIENALDALMKHELRIVITSREQGLHVLGQSRALSKNAALEWMESLRLVATPAIIRTQYFTNGNSRIDVIAAPKEEKTKELHGWSMQGVGSGSALHFGVAMKETHVLFSDDTQSLENAMRQIDAPERAEHRMKGVMAGTADTAWLLQAWSEHGEHENDQATLLRTLIGKQTKRITWEATDAGQVLHVNFWVKE